MNKEQIEAYEKQLKPCPFCGCKPRLSNSGIWWWVVCREDRYTCGANVSTMQIDSPDNAIAIWNKGAEK